MNQALQSKALVEAVKIELPIPSKSGAAKKTLNPFPAPDRALRIGVLDNSKAGARTIIEALAKRLGERAPSFEIFVCRKTHASLPMTDEIQEELGTADLVITALGDCGSCTSWMIHDAVALEEAGKPVIAVCSKPFAVFGKAQAKSLGLEELRLLTIGHPIAELLEPEVLKKVDEISGRFDDLIARPVTSGAVVDDGPAPTAKFEVGLDSDLIPLLEKHGLSDGLPIVAPTSARIEEMLSTYKGNPDDVLGQMAPKYGTVTPRLLASAAVMAGCLPSYMPVIAAATKALLVKDFNLNGVQSTTHPVAVFTLVSGPIAPSIGMNSGINAFGQGNRANATIGRALRLAMLSLGGARPGNGDMATLGSPAKYTFCAAENTAESPWESLGQTRGFSADQSVVTVVGCEAPQNVNDHESESGLGILRMIAGTMKSVGANNSYYVNGQVVIVISPEHALTMARDGYSRKAVQDYLYQEARTPISFYSEANIRQRLQTRFPLEYGEYGAHTTVPIVHSADNILICVVGGPGKHSMFVPTFGANRAVSMAIEI